MTDICVALLFRLSRPSFQQFSWHKTRRRPACGKNTHRGKSPRPSLLARGRQSPTIIALADAAPPATNDVRPFPPWPADCTSEGTKTHEEVLCNSRLSHSLSRSWRRWRLRKAAAQSSQYPDRSQTGSQSTQSTQSSQQTDTTTTQKSTDKADKSMSSKTWKGTLVDASCAGNMSSSTRDVGLEHIVELADRRHQQPKHGGPQREPEQQRAVPARIAPPNPDTSSSSSTTQQPPQQHGPFQQLSEQH